MRYSGFPGKRVELQRAGMMPTLLRINVELDDMIPFWGAQASSLQSSAACRRHSVRRALNCTKEFSASCRKRQAGSLCSPDARVHMPHRIRSTAAGTSSATQSAMLSIVSRSNPVRTRIVRTPALRPHSASISLSPIKNERARSMWCSRVASMIIPGAGLRQLEG